MALRVVRCLASLVLAAPRFVRAASMATISADGIAVPVTGATSRFPEHMRPGFRTMMPIHEEALASAIAAGREIVVLDDKSLGAVVIALRGPPGTEGPVVAMIAGRTSTAEPPFWSFPKGHPDAGEDDVTAALREVREEIGVDCAPFIRPEIFEEQSYTFTSRLHMDRWRAHPAFPDESCRPHAVYHKLVRYYLCVLPAALPLVLQEAEVSEAAWVPLPDALGRMPRADMREPFERFFASDAVRALLR